MRVTSLTDMQLDALREVGSIGAGHAATALSQLVDRPVTLDVPEIRVVEISDVPSVFGGPEHLVFAVYSRLVGDVAGSVLFLVPSDSALLLVDLLQGRPAGTTELFGPGQEELLRHVASILVSAYLAAIARMADLSILPSEPAAAFDMAGALLEAVISEAGMRADAAVFVSTTFIDEGRSVEGALFFVPDPDSLLTILTRIGVA